MAVLEAEQLLPIRSQRSAGPPQLSRASAGHVQLLTANGLHLLINQTAPFGLRLEVVVASRAGRVDEARLLHQPLTPAGWRAGTSGTPSVRTGCVLRRAGGVVCAASMAVRTVSTDEGEGSGRSGRVSARPAAVRAAWGMQRQHLHPPCSPYCSGAGKTRPLRPASPHPRRRHGTDGHDAAQTTPPAGAARTPSVPMVSRMYQPANLREGGQESELTCRSQRLMQQAGLTTRPAGMLLPAGHRARHGEVEAGHAQPMLGELWRTSERWDLMGKELFRSKTPWGRLCLGPTHEETVTLVTRKFRDEPKPRFGLLRGREFYMKDM
ncbi:putative proline--tRNA ligase, mitochondrial [Merluccius polli]|uniref:Proline--tRNA ligase, mitochondrial n=1 Tax=Merluccius polli TaxID=89951 RepID=A0AA47NQ29_MERPO|nr:putative proline--tRNA ligase, mitochondrial [Merluccius polli]